MMLRPGKSVQLLSGAGGTAFIHRNGVQECGQLYLPTRKPRTVTLVVDMIRGRRDQVDRSARTARNPATGAAAASKKIAIRASQMPVCPLSAVS
jgi:hypothetical protein